MTPADKKRRGGASLHNKLTPEQRAQLAEWLTLQNLTYEDAAELVQSQFGLSTSVDALRRFYASFAVPWQYAQASGEAENFGTLIEGNFDAPTLKRVKQLAFSALTDRAPNMNVVKALLKIVGDSAKVDLAKERLALDQRKVKLLEAKAALADQAKDIANNPQLTEEEQGARMRTLFRMS